MYTMKKICSFVLASALTAVCFSGCDSTSNDMEEKFQIGIVQIIEHTSLNTIRETMLEELEKLGLDESKVEIDYKNAANDQANLNTICQKFVSDQKDLIVAIATPSALAAANATEDIPIVFSAVTDPVSSGLMSDMEHPDSNITGTSDFVDAEKILELAFQITPDIQSMGLLYCSSEPNSKVVIDKAKAYLEAKNVDVKIKAVTNDAEIQQAGTSLASEVDAMFSPIDNTVANNMSILSEICLDKKIPFYVSADSMVSDGGFATEGINYVDLGQKTAEIVKQIYDGMAIADIPVVILKDTKTYINQTVAGQLGITIPEEISQSATFFE